MQISLNKALQVYKLIEDYLPEKPKEGGEGLEEIRLMLLGIIKKSPNSLFEMLAICNKIDIEEIKGMSADEIITLCVQNIRENNLMVLKKILKELYG